MAGAWGKLFSDKNKVTSTCTVKGADGVTRTVKSVIGATGLSDADFADAVKAGSATLTESRKSLKDDGSEVQLKNTIKPGDITTGEAYAAVADLLGLAAPAEKAKPKSNAAAA
jgi:hypothetical protein